MRRLGSVIGIFTLVLVACEGDQAPVSGPEAVEGPSLESAVQPHPMNANPPSRDGRGLEGAIHGGGALISNGTVQLGVHPEGHLNIPGGTPSSGTSSTTVVGLRYVPTNGEATAPGCLCEGWGVADASTGIFGNASEDTGGVDNLTVISFDHTPTTATSVVEVGSTFRVTHDYFPSPATPNLYQVDVTIENISGGMIGDLRYTRGMDWDISPNTFSEFSTIQGAVAATNVILANNNGFNDVNPLAFHGDIGFSGDFVDAGPLDHGAHFDFGFGSLDVGESFSFTTFYGAAGTESAANAALGAVGAEVFSYGQANCSDCASWEPLPGNGHPTGMDGATSGRPHTFIFAFEGVGGAPIIPPGGGMVGTACPVTAADNTITPTRFGPITFWLGTDGPDIAVGGPGVDIFIMKGGDDLACGLGGRDVFNGGSGDDTWYGGPGNDVALGMEGSDTLHGEGGLDRNDGGHTGPTDQVDLDVDTCSDEDDQNFLCEVITGRPAPAPDDMDDPGGDLLSSLRTGPAADSPRERVVAGASRTLRLGGASR